MPTGVITEEYLDGLDRLRLRLGEYLALDKWSINDLLSCLVSLSESFYLFLPFSTINIICLAKVVKYKNGSFESLTQSQTFFSHTHTHLQIYCLGLTVEDATNLLGVAARMRITPVVKDLVNMWKSDTGAAKREDKVR